MLKVGSNRTVGVVRHELGAWNEGLFASRARDRKLLLTFSIPTLHALRETMERYSLQPRTNDLNAIPCEIAEPETPTWELTWGRVWT
jgi:hypothetical protein